MFSVSYHYLDPESVFQASKQNCQMSSTFQFSYMHLSCTYVLMPCKPKHGFAVMYEIAVAMADSF